MVKQFYVIVTVEETSAWDTAEEVAEYLHNAVIEYGEGIVSIDGAKDN